MGTALLLVTDRQSIGLTGSRIERGAFRVISEATELTGSAVSEARRILDDAHAHAAAIAEQARHEGWEAGRREGLVALMGTLEVERRMGQALADRIAQLVVQAVRTLVGELGEHDLFHRRVLQLLARADDAAPPMRLHVCPAQAPLAKSVVDDLISDRGEVASGAWLAVVSDEMCARDTIVLETATGFIDGDIELTLADLRTIIQRAVAHADARWSGADHREGPDHGA